MPFLIFCQIICILSYNLSVLNHLWHTCCVLWYQKAIIFTLTQCNLSNIRTWASAFFHIIKKALYPMCHRQISRCTEVTCLLEHHRTNCYAVYLQKMNVANNVIHNMSIDARCGLSNLRIFRLEWCVLRYMPLIVYVKTHCISFLLLIIQLLPFQKYILKDFAL